LQRYLLLLVVESVSESSLPLHCSFMFPQIVFLNFVATLTPIVPIIIDVRPSHGAHGLGLGLFDLLILLSFLVDVTQLESASPYSGLHPHQCLHASHSHLGLLSHIVSPHQCLQPHQSLQCSQCTPSLRMQFIN